MANNGWPTRWFRQVVSVKESYRTKRGALVGEATLACGHTALVNMDPPAKRRACWDCCIAGRVAYQAPSPSSSVGGDSRGTGGDA